jgi:hypothetical protein
MSIYIACEMLCSILTDLVEGVLDLGLGPLAAALLTLWIGHLRGLPLAILILIPVLTSKQVIYTQ